MSPGCDGIVQFDYIVWSMRYSELSGSVPQPLAQAYFDEATLFLNNTPRSPVRDMVARAVILGMLTAHIAQLNAPLNGQASSSLVGRISNASEGSVSVATDMGTQPARAAWLNQTKYGAAAYQAMTPYFTGGRYQRGRQPYLGVGPYHRGLA